VAIKRPGDYRHSAAACGRWRCKSSSLQDRLALLEVAQQYDRVAEKAEAIEKDRGPLAVEDRSIPVRCSKLHRHGHLTEGTKEGWTGVMSCTIRCLYAVETAAAVLSGYDGRTVARKPSASNAGLLSRTLFCVRRRNGPSPSSPTKLLPTLKRTAANAVAIVTHTGFLSLHHTSTRHDPVRNRATPPDVRIGCHAAALTSPTRSPSSRR